MSGGFSIENIDVWHWCECAENEDQTTQRAHVSMSQALDQSPSPLSCKCMWPVAGGLELWP